MIPSWTSDLSAIYAREERILFGIVVVVVMYRSTPDTGNMSEKSFKSASRFLSRAVYIYVGLEIVRWSPFNPLGENAHCGQMSANLRLHLSHSMYAATWRKTGGQI